MTGRKTNAILAANGGLDSARALNKAREILRFHDLRQPVLYHVVITGSESVATYQATIKALVRRLRNYGCRTEYFGAFENQPLKGMHAHCFLLIETSKKTPGKIMNIGDDEYLHKLVRSKPVLKLNDGKPLNRVHIAKPKNPMHGGDFFARPVGDKLANCLEWVTYIFKMRSKQGVDRRETYFNSEFTANKAIRAAELDALTAAPTATPTTTTTKGDTMILTTAERYIATIYEGCIDRGMDVGAIRAYLADRGIARTPGQLRHDLDNVYSFAGYWRSHPAPAVQDVAAMDKAIDQMTSGQLKLYDLAAPVQLAPTRKRHIVSAYGRRQVAG
jgi:hypothetical protein